MGTRTTPVDTQQLEAMAMRKSSMTNRCLHLNPEVKDCTDKAKGYEGMTTAMNNQKSIQVQTIEDETSLRETLLLSVWNKDVVEFYIQLLKF